MFNKLELYEYLMEFEATSESDKMFWLALATKFYIETEDPESSKLFDVITKAERYQVIVPDAEMASGWNFIKEHQSKISSPHDLEKIVLEYGLTTTTSNTGSASI
jgi:hypothetical protein